MNTELIYDELIQKVKELIENITNEEVENEEIEQAKKETQKILEDRRIKLENNVKELKENSEWDTFTMAFYGETNAGKSTLIETLRILLNEETKLNDRKEFDKIGIYRNKYNEEDNQIKNNINETRLRLEKILEEEKLKKEEEEKNIKEKDNLENKIDILKNIKLEYDKNNGKVSIEGESLEDIIDLEKIKTDIAKKTEKYDIEIEKQNIEIEELKEILEKKIAKRNIFRKIICFIFNKKEEEEIKINEIKKNIKEEKKEKEKEILKIFEEPLNKQKENLKLFSIELVDINNKNKKINNQIESLVQEYKKFEVNLKNLEEKEKELNKKILEIEEKLEKYEDGKIIGDGQSDYTRENKEYKFEIDNQKFAIIDMPGIEGKEEDVEKQILSAIKKAHSVFYITGKATPPQTGDENKKGTLEKIKEQLGLQTEVRTIYNKRITNKIQLTKDLITIDEKDSLKEVDKKMREILGKNYEENMVISAKPSYLAAARCLSKKNTDYEKREKFLEQFSEDEILELSGMKQFIFNLSSQMIRGFKEKIKKSNYNKIVYTLNEVIKEISFIQKEKIEKTEKNLMNKYIMLKIK